MTATLEGGEWSAARPGRTLPPGKTRYPFYRRLGGPQCRYIRAENLVPAGIRSRTVQPVVSRYTDWATCWEVELSICALSVNYWSASQSGRISRGVKVPHVHWLGGLVALDPVRTFWKTGSHTTRPRWSAPSLLTIPTTIFWFISKHTHGKDYKLCSAWTM